MLALNPMFQLLISLLIMGRIYPCDSGTDAASQNRKIRLVEQCFTHYNAVSELFTMPLGIREYLDICTMQKVKL